MELGYGQLANQRTLDALRISTADSSEYNTDTTKSKWMTGIIIEEYLRWFNNKMRSQGRRVLLLLDNFSGHKLGVNLVSSQVFKQMVLYPKPSPTGHVTTTVLTNNIHCASCLSYIQKLLSILQPAPLSISANYVSHEVTIVHSPEHSENDISRALSDAAFEVQSVRTEDKFGHIIYEPDIVQVHQEWLEQGAQTLSKQASTLP